MLPNNGVLTTQCWATPQVAIRRMSPRLYRNPEAYTNEGLLQSYLDATLTDWESGEDFVYWPQAKKEITRRVSQGRMTIDNILHLLKSDYVGNRQAAVSLLQSINHAKAPEALQQTLETDPDATVRVMAVSALAESVGRESVSILIGKLASDRDTSVQIAIVDALAKLRTTEAVAVVNKWLEDHDNAQSGRREARGARGTNDPGSDNCNIEGHYLKFLFVHSWQRF